MNQTGIIQQALADGVLISVDGPESLALTGDQGAVDRWVPVIRENKVFILAELCTGKNNDSCPPLPERTCRRVKRLPSKVALQWLLEHRQALDNAGWTRAELYSRKKYKPGIVWLSLWDEAFNMAFLHDSGEIEFECSIHGRDYFQTARPAAMAPTKDPIEVKS